MLAHVGPEQRVPRPLGSPPNVKSHFAKLEVCGGKRWPIPSEMQLRCRMCKARGVTQKVFMKWPSVKWDCTLKKTCFEDYYTKAQF